MKNLICLFSLFISLFSYGKNQYKINLVSKTANDVVVEFELENYQLISYNKTGLESFKKLIVEGGISTLSKGDPKLLKFTSNIQLPAKGISSFSIISSDFIELENVNIAPSKGNLYRNIDPNSIQFQKGNTYNIDSDFPSQIFSLGTPYIHRDVRAQTINFIPFGFNPVKKTIKIYNKIRVIITFLNKEIGLNELDISPRKFISKEIEKTYKRRYINYHTTRYTSLGQDGSMLIISPSEYFDELEPFISWKRKSGLEVKLVDIATIGNNQSSIYNYVRNYYNQNADFLNLLLVGDHNKVASYNTGTTTGWSPEIKWSDSKYGLVSNSNDWYPDIYVGRFSPSNLMELNIMIQRNLEYEVTPEISNYYSNAIGLGSNEGAGYGDDGEADWQHLRNIRTDLLNFGYQNVYEFYDGTHGGEDVNGNPNSTQISNAVNSGVSLFNYTGHGAQNALSSGNFYSTQVANLDNNNKYPFVISVSCNAGTFSSGTCISEVWQRASKSGSPTGSIAASGSSILMSWAPPMATQDEIVDILVESYPNNQMHTIGALFYSGQMKMLDDYPNYGKEVIETWVLFGDPATLFRSKTPNDFLVTHSDKEEIGITSLTVFCDEDEAKVTLWNGDSLIGRNFVVNGQAEFSFEAINEIDTLDIVINAYNKIPYFGSMRTIAPLPDPMGNSTDLLFGPNPLQSDMQLSLIFELKNDQSVYFEIYNPLGQVVYSISNELTAGFYGPNYTPMLLDLTKIGLKSGIYALSTNINDTKMVKQLFVP
jgi:gingipain R